MGFRSPVLYSNMEKKSLSTVITSSRNLFQNSQKKTGFIFLGSAEPCRSRILSYIRWVRRRATGCARSLWQGKYSVQIFEFLFIIWYFLIFLSFWFFSPKLFHTEMILKQRFVCRYFSNYFCNNHRPGFWFFNFSQIYS